MERTTREALQVYRRGRDFLKPHEVTTPLGSTAQHVAELSDAIDRLSAFAVQQDRSARAASAGTRNAREQARNLRKKYLRPVSQLAKTLFAKDSAVRKSLQMPKADDYEGLIGATKAMAEQAALHKAEFVQAGFGEAFVEAVLAAADSLRKALDDRDAALGRRAAARAGLRAQMKRGGNTLRLLDMMVSSEWAEEKDRLAEWKTLTRFDQPASEEEEAGTTPVVTLPVVLPSAPATVGTISPPVVPVSTEVTGQPKVA